MGRFDRYMLGELIKLFGFFGLVLVLIYWINRAVALFDTLIADGQSARVFLEMTTLTLPSIIAIVLPFAAFAAAAYVTFRLERDSELVVIQATGFSPFRLARPVLFFGGIVMLMMLVLTNLLQPMAAKRLEYRQAEIARNLTGRLLTPGQFVDAGAGFTAYIRDLTRNGTLEDVLLSDRRDPAQPVTYSASRAYLLRADDGPMLVMENGMIQVLRDGRLYLTRFDHMSYDVSQLIGDITPDPRRPWLLPTAELLRAGHGLSAETGDTIAQLQARGHRRIALPVLSAIAALVGFAPLLMGGFSRFGLGPQLASAIGLVIALMALDNVGLRAAQQSAGAWPMAYLAPLIGAGVTMLMLGAAARGPVRRRQRGGNDNDRRPAPAGDGAAP